MGLLLPALALFAEGRGDNPDGGGSGVLIIVVSIVVAVVVIGGILTLVQRKTRG